MTAGAATRKRSVLVRALSVAGALALGVVFYFVFVVALIAGFFHPTPPIARGLSSTIAMSEQQFEDRVEATFPLGSSEAEMIETLERQGFTRQEADFGGDVGRLPYMGVSLPRGFCGVNISIYWEAEQGRLTEVRGNYGVTCL